MVNRLSCAINVHEEAWSKAVKEALNDKYTKYGLYTARVLTISHPEILLKGDTRFINHITANTGYSNSYAVKDVHSREFLTDMQFRKYPCFKFDAVEFDAFKLVLSGDLYPEGYPVMPFLDRRMLPVASTLKTRTNTVTELEKTALIYQRERVKRGSHDGLFIVHCGNEKTYLFIDDELVDASNEEKTEALDENPVIIFNEEYVWYPLMDRYDESPVLDEVVKRYANEKKSPDLTDFESKIIGKLKDVTRLENEAQWAMAELCSCRSTGRQTCTTPLSEWFPLHSLWDLALPAKKARAWQYYGYLEQILIRGNKLSPLTAYLAALSLEAEGYDKLVVLNKEWVGRVALPNYGYVWGHLWDECLVEYNIDESFRTSAGHCMVQGMIMSAVLEMVGIDNWLMEGEVPGSHHYVWIPDYEVTFDNARMKISMNNVILDWPRGNKVLARFHHNGRFCSPIAGGEYSGSLSPEECVDELDTLASKYGNVIPIYANGKHETEPTVLNRNNRAITEDYKTILKEEWENLQLP